jgi:hypothetical protein
MTCELCKTETKDWDGDDRSCSFPDTLSGQNLFSREGWNCATANAIRDLTNQDFQTIPNSHSTYCEDQYYSTIKVNEVDLLDGDALTLWVSWYKHRGRTDAMWLLNEYDTPRIPTERDCLAIINFYKEKK